MAIFTSAASNYRYARLFLKQNTLSFQQAHALFFKDINGVYKTVVYDNMKVAVKKFVGYSEKEPTDGLLKLSLYYNFDFRFCNIQKGNEKGHVEKSVEYVRRKAFCKKDIFNTIESANKYLLEICTKLNQKPIKSQNNKTPQEILAKEKPYLLPIMPVFECSVPSNLKVDKYSTISVDTCHYSVPEEYVGKVIFSKIYPDKVICYDNNNIIAFHMREHGSYKWFIKLEHYLQTFKKKPGAFKNSVAFNQASEKIKRIYKKYYSDNVKDFIELMHFIYTKNKTIEEIEQAILNLIKLNINTITTDQIKLVLCNKNFKQASNDDLTSPIIEFSKKQLLCIYNLIPEDNFVKMEVKYL